LDKLKQIDSILKKAAADVHFNDVIQSSDWDAIEHKLKKRKRRIIVLWSFIALMFTTSIVTLIVTQDSLTDELEYNEASYENINNERENSLAQDIEAPGKTKLTNKSNDFEKNYKIPLVKSNNQKITVTKEDKKVVNNDYNELIITINSKSVNTFSQTLPEIKLEKIFLVRNRITKKSNNPESFIKRWEYGIAFTPSISNKFTQKNSSLSGLINRNYNQYIGKQEKSSFASNFGFNLSYHINSKLFISSGLYLTQRAEYLNYKYTITDFPIVTNGEITDYAPLNPLAYVDVNHIGSNLYHFIEIPLNFGIKQPISSNFEIRAQFGVSFLSLTKLNGKKGNYLNLQLEDLSDLKFNKHNIATTVKTGLYYNKPRFNVGLEPSYSININSLNNAKTYALKTRPYAYGVNLITNIKIFKNE
jgi:hypothetical protein